MVVKKPFELECLGLQGSYPNKCNLNLKLTWVLTWRYALPYSNNLLSPVCKNDAKKIQRIIVWKKHWRDFMKIMVLFLPQSWTKRFSGAFTRNQRKCTLFSPAPSNPRLSPKIYQNFIFVVRIYQKVSHIV